jgi:hypothetical protein
LNRLPEQKNRRARIRGLAAPNLLTAARLAGRVHLTAASGGFFQGRSEVLIDHRAYRILPGRVPAQLDLYSKLAYPVQLRYMGEPHYYLVSETGQLNMLVHGWVYDSAGDREQKRAKMMQDPDWKHFLAENAKAGNVIEQSNWLMTPAPFAPKIPPAKIVK